MSFNPKTKRYSYTAGGEYTLSGSDYIGYFNIENNIPRTGRTATSKSQILLPTDKIAVDMYQYKIEDNLIFPDRLIVDAISLPNGFEEIKIPVNEIVTKSIFNAHIKRVYENTIYLYSKLNIASNDIPNGYLYWVGVSGVSGANPLSASTSRWNPANLLTINESYGSIGYPELDNCKKSATVISKDGQVYITFAVSDTTLSVISSKSDKSDTQVVFSTSAIDLNSDKSFSMIEDISVNGDHLYITDSINNAVYKYDISGYIVTDVTRFNTVYLIDVIGYLGDENNRSGFNEPAAVEAISDRVYIHDRVNKCIKTYTKDFTWVNTLILDINYSIIDIKFNDYFGNLFILADKGNSDFIIMVLDKDAKKILNEYDLDEKYEEIIDGEIAKISIKNKNRISYVIDPRERLRGIRFSSQDSNIFYVFSNYTVYKKFITKPEATIGKWSITRAGISWGYIWNFIDVNYNNLSVAWNTISGSGRENINIADMNIISREDNYDDIFMPVKANSPECFKILYFKESTLYDTALKSRDISIYNTTRLGMQEGEYVNALTINKELYKQIFNIFAIRNLLKGKFAGSYNRAGNLVYEQYDYLQDEEMQSIMVDNSNDLYVHENEHVSSEVLNRPLKKIFNLQQKLLNIVDTRVKNITPTLALTGLNILLVE